mmetsp:Transcript_60096/g.125748  ORF Transcript_60096/g.125748 Transcript_60096/m.125748 type:complete len:91 (+) Transcript_60096:331-603(+)
MWSGGEVTGRQAESCKRGTAAVMKRVGARLEGERLTDSSEAFSYVATQLGSGGDEAVAGGYSMPTSCARVERERKRSVEREGGWGREMMS